MSDLLLYSTNVLLKYYICNQFYNNIHYVWCSETFDASKSAQYTSGSMIAPTSNPHDIYDDLKKAVDKHDVHNSKIIAQMASIKAVAIQKHQASDITDGQKDEIIYMVGHADFSHWRPLVYIIPRPTVGPRLKVVPIQKRASFGKEYIIKDLHTDEFDVIEF